MEHEFDRKFDMEAALRRGRLLRAEAMHQGFAALIARISEIWAWPIRFQGTRYRSASGLPLRSRAQRC